MIERADPLTPNIRSVYTDNTSHQGPDIAEVAKIMSYSTSSERGIQEATNRDYKIPDGGRFVLMMGQKMDGIERLIIQAVQKRADPRIIRALAGLLERKALEHEILESFKN